MENASKALLIAGAILLSILIIAIGMFIYNSAQSTINNSMQSMSTQEVQAFNNEFMSFEGKQTGSNIKAMIGTLIANANTYRDEPAKIPGLVFDKINNTKKVSDNKATVAATIAFNDSGALVKIPPASQPANYVSALNVIRNYVEPKHQYWVTITNQDNGIIDAILVTYEASTQGPADALTDYINGDMHTKHLEGAAK